MRAAAPAGPLSPAEWPSRTAAGGVGGHTGRVGGSAGLGLGLSRSEADQRIAGASEEAC